MEAARAVPTDKQMVGEESRPKLYIARYRMALVGRVSSLPTFLSDRTKSRDVDITLLIKGISASCFGERDRGSEGFGREGKSKDLHSSLEES